MALTEVTLNPGVGGNQIGVDAIAGVDYEVVKQAFGDEGALTMVSPTNPLPVTSKKSSGSAITSVNVSGSNQNLLASNALRLGATIFNNSQINLYLILGTTATTSNFTVILVGQAYYEIPFGYTGNIDGIWASAGSGASLITELT